MICHETASVVTAVSGAGLWRMLRTVEAEMKIFNRASWLAIRTRPQLILDFVIAHIRAAIYVGVLFAGEFDCLCSSILCSHR